MGRDDDERYRRGRGRFLEIHDEKALRSVEGLDDLGRLIVETVYGDIYSRPGLSDRDRELAAGFPPAMNAMSTLKTILADREPTED